MTDQNVLAGLMEILAELTGDPAFALPPQTPPSPSTQVKEAENPPAHAAPRRPYRAPPSP